MKAFVTLAVFILSVPALLLAQTPTGPSTSAPKTNDAKPAYATPAEPGAQQSTTPAGSPQSATKSAAQATEPAKPKAPAAYPVMSAKAKDRARQLSEQFIHGETGVVFAAFTPDMKKQSGEEKLATMLKQMNTAVGTPGDMLAENFLPGLTAPVTMYARTSKYSKSRVPVMVAVAVNEDGELTDLQVVPVPFAQRDEYFDYQDQTKLRLPFDGSWIVLQGGRTPYDNAYAQSDDNKYTVSFVFTKDGAAFENTGRRNTDFYCYGQPVLAPAAGTVVQAVGNYQDHAPGRSSEMMSRGNYVVIAHGNSEFSMIPYMKAGSVKVRPGQRVKQGQVIGECGNSGSSVAPHLEYSLQNTRGFPLPKTMPAQFVDYVADGKPVPIGEPLRGQVIANPLKGTPVETADKPQPKPQ